ncbi:MAG TPA: hypothetical protein VN577_08980 [Terriglobales bacterium]|nr:hypothetical protein [Terriglobales bacterium]
MSAIPTIASLVAQDTEDPTRFQSIDESAEYIGRNGLAPTYTPGSDISSATGQIVPDPPTKQTLRTALRDIFNSFRVGAGQAMMAHAGIENETQQAERKARTEYYNAQSEAERQQSKPTMLIDPANGKPMYDNDGNIMLGTLAHQKELNDQYRVTGGFIPIPVALAHSVGYPELAGRNISANSLTALINSQDRGETLDQEITRLAKVAMKAGRDPNQDESVQQLISVRNAVKDKAPTAGQLDQQYLDLYAKKLRGEGVSKAEESWMKAYEKQKTLNVATSFNLRQSANNEGLTPTQLAKVNTLATQFDSNPVIKAYNEQVNKAQTVRQVVTGKVGGPGDLAVVYEFMKGLDPTSVVRESEYDTASKSGNIFAGALAKFNGYLRPEGGFLPDNVKQDFLRILDQKLSISRSQAKRMHSDFARRINKITGNSDGAEYLTDYSQLYDGLWNESPAGGVEIIRDPKTNRIIGVK